MRWFSSDAELVVFLGFKGNVIGGYKARDFVYSKSRGGFFVGPSDACDLLDRLHKLGYIVPTKFQPIVNGTEHVLAMTYNGSHIRNVLPGKKSIRCHEDSWCWEVVKIPAAK